MILLSYSTLNELINCPHTWLCKQMGLQRFRTQAMQEGADAHTVIQRHVSGVERDPRLSKLMLYFPVVETRQQDPATHFEYQIDDEYSIHGYMDGKHEELERGLEIKTSSTLWGMTKFYNLMQWRIAALAQPWLKEMWFITATRDLRNPVCFTLPVTDKHRQEALAWIQRGIAIIESGDFSYDGQGRSRYCNYLNCPFCGL